MLIYFKIHFSYNFQMAFLQQVIVRQNTSGKRIFDRHYSAVACALVRRNLYHFAKCSTTDNLNLVPKKLAGGNLVKTSFKPLYRYFFTHCNKQESRLLAGILLCYLFKLSFNKSLLDYF